MCSEISHRRGFTLIEQLIVIALIVAVVGFGAVRMIQVYQDNSFDHASKDLTAVLRFLQMKSIEDGKIYELSISSDQKRLQVKRQVKGEQELKPLKSAWLQSIRIGESLSLSFERGGNLLFYPDGTTSTNPLTISKETGEKQTLNLKNRVGSVEIKKNHL